MYNCCLSCQVRYNQMICKGSSLIVTNKIYSLHSLLPRGLFLLWGGRAGKKRERPGDYEKGHEMNIGYIQSSWQIRRHLEMHYRAARSALDPIGLNPLVTLWSLQNEVFFIASTLHLDEILLSKCSSMCMSLKFLRKKSFRRAWVGIEPGV